MRQQPKSWDSQREGEEKGKRERKLCLEKLKPKAPLARSQNKGLTEHQGRASQQRTGPSPAEGREAGRRQSQKARGILYQTVSRLLLVLNGPEPCGPE